jgi:hypothetical protein
VCYESPEWVFDGDGDDDAGASQSDARAFRDAGQLHRDPNISLESSSVIRNILLNYSHSDRFLNLY